MKYFPIRPLETEKPKSEKEGSEKNNG